MEEKKIQAVVYRIAKAMAVARRSSAPSVQSVPVANVNHLVCGQAAAGSRQNRTAHKSHGASAALSPGKLEGAVWVVRA